MRLTALRRRRSVVATAALLALASAVCSSSSSGSDATTAVSVTTLVATSAVAPTAPATSDAVTTSAAPEVVTIHADGFGEAMLNDEPESVIAYFTELFGAPTVDSGWLPNSEVPLCDTDSFRAVSWPNLYAVFAARDALGAGRVPDQRFVYFSYGLTNGIWPDEPFATDEGLLPGDPVTTLQALYPGVQVYDGSLGGGRFYKTSDDRNLGPNGSLTGSPEVVAVIEAGDWPCQDTD